MDLYIGYRTTVKVLGALITFPLFYFLQYKLVHYLTDSRTAIWYLISLPLSGIGAWAYAYHVQPRIEAFQWRQFRNQNPEMAADIATRRTHLASQVDDFLRK